MEEKARPYEVVWSNHAENSLTQIADYIAIDSQMQAEKTRLAIIKLSFTLSTRALHYEECPELLTPNSRYRKATNGVYKIIYKIAGKEI